MTKTTMVAMALVTMVGCGLRLPAGENGAAEPPVGTPVAGPMGAPGASGAHRSGTRIKMISGSTSDGATMFRGWFDTDLGTACEFRKGASGWLRCLPTNMAFVRAQLQQPASSYADAACTVPVATMLAQTDCTGDGPQYAQDDNGTCGGNRVYALGSRVYDYYRFVNGACEVGFVEADKIYRLLGAEVPETVFTKMAVGVVE